MYTKLLQTHRPALRTGLRAGNTASDACYSSRNRQNLSVAFNWFWKLLHIPYQETGASHTELIICLATSGEPDWWTAFPPMTREEACEITWSWSSLKNNEERLALVKDMNCESSLKSIGKI